MDWLTGIGLLAVAGLAIAANGPQLASLLKWMAPVRPDDPIPVPVPDDEHEHDENEYHRHIAWLREIAQCRESRGDQVGLALAGKLALHLTESHFAPEAGQ
jgi:hypothetical protein